MKSQAINLLKERTKNVQEWFNELTQRQDNIDESIEKEADEIEKELEIIFEQEADMIEQETEDQFNREADEIEQEISNQK